MTNSAMVNNSMEHNSKTIRVDGIRYRQIPNFASYGVSALGAIINLKTKTELFTSDFSHWSGRYSLYNKNGSTRFNAAELVEMTWGPKQVSRMRNQLAEYL